MEFIIISENKIKVMLTEEDLREFEIDAEELDYSNTDTKKMFWDILSRVKHSTGFDTDGQKVLVQLYPSRHGGCEMFVTKIGALPTSSNDSPSEKSAPAADGVSLKKAPKPKSQTRHKASISFSFASIEEILSVCRQLSALQYKGDSYAYYDGIHSYYLVLGGIDISDFFSFGKYSFISEFGHMENKDLSEHYLSEMGVTISQKNAVNVLSRL